jgi:hypothetical protein
VNAICWSARGEEVLHLHLQNFGEIEHRFVVHVGEPRFDFRNAAPARVEPRELKFRREIRLRPAKCVASTAHLRTGVVFVAHRRVLGALQSLWLRGLEAHAGRLCRLAELDQFAGFEIGQRGTNCRGNLQPDVGDKRTRKDGLTTRLPARET